jgi:hypothetical protein
MTTPPAASFIDALLGLALGSTGPDAANRLSLQGLALRPADGGALEIGIARIEAASLRLASGPLALDVGHLAVNELVALVRIEAGRPRVASAQAASVELSGLKVQGPLVLPRHAGGDAAHPWSLGPLAGANGTLRAEIVDAHLLFDADVTVPIREGQVDFKDAAVEHVGPDSRMGASRLGFYVDAPNGRSYLYQFTSTPVAGVEYERRGSLPGPWNSDRGKLQLQAFGEWLLRQPWSEGITGITEQARQLFDRTRLDGELRLGDGRFAAPGVQAEVVGRAEGRNVVRVHSEAVGQGLHVDVDSLLARSAVLGLRGTQVRCDEVEGALKLRLFVEDAQMRFAFDLVSLKVSGIRLDGRAP